MKIHPIAWLAGFLPLLTIHLCYGVAAALDHIPTCIPYIHSCTSISSAGREVPEFYLFKLLMIPSAIVIMGFWTLASGWLRGINKTRKYLPKLVLMFGLIACLGLIVYSLALGRIGPEYRLQRRIGVIIFFALTFVSQYLFFVGLTSSAELRQKNLVLIKMLGLVLLGVVLFAVSAVIISAVNTGFYDRLEDAFEWWVTALQCIYVLIVARIWQQTSAMHSTESNLYRVK